jgi:hypothetical protein
MSAIYRSAGEAKTQRLIESVLVSSVAVELRGCGIVASGGRCGLARSWRAAWHLDQSLERRLTISWHFSCTLQGWL